MMSQASQATSPDDVNPELTESESNMTTTIQQGSARIYQFPVGGRAALNAQRDAAKPAEAIRTPKAVSSSWYHDAAIAEDLASKPQ
jgi:hypothetical protein